MNNIKGAVSRSLQGLAQLFKLVGRVFALVWLPFALLWRGIRWVTRTLFGSLSYEAPVWFTAGFHALRAGVRYLSRVVRAWMAADRRRAVATIAAVIVALLAYAWYEGLPKPREATFTVNNPARTRIEDPRAKPDPVVVSFSQAVAPIDRIGKEVIADISISPQVEGTWFWENDRRLQFTPRADWPVGTDFTVNFARGLVAGHVALKSYRARFHTARFETSIREVQFYQDPAEPTAKKVVATATLTHPVDNADFEKRVKLRREGKSGGFLGIGAEETKLRISYDRLRLNAYIHSEPLPIPAKDQRLDIVVDSGVRASQGGKPTDSEIARKVTIPGLYSLKVRNISVSHVDNEQKEPDRLVVVNFSSDVPESEMAEKLQAWLLPVYHPETPEKDRKYPHAWNDTQRIGADILKQSEVMKLEPIAAERESVEA